MIVKRTRFVPGQKFHPKWCDTIHLISWTEGCPFAFLIHAQCLLSSNWSTPGTRDCLNVSFIWDFKLIFGRAGVLCQVLDITSTEKLMVFWGKILQCLIIINSLLNYRVNKKPTKQNQTTQPVNLIKKTEQSTAFSITVFGVLTLQHSSQTNQAVPRVNFTWAPATMLCIDSVWKSQRRKRQSWR